ncbi:DUF300-domain-containing protein [Gloeophyllum trabeum ATCC 11539]|uniref:DUF300-domain-containing protein n=1 Tax=Gloeophyllum trabeum (strain ATCC 11539 / FP-39264 / Madison 617) TaxID=670483 RepID=S7RG70_GLOTA|nr:DUF300-domain-containing protein [Gloeophyllum trabeum ATCC 11539]EPQ51504.1 DUF300-domain-containing protein [Gloeophyllum trabeum ATCC 11539]
MVVRIMLMVPIYAISSLISLFSLGAAFVIDAIRDIYEAFVIYCFFQLLVAYLGGERSLLIMVHGRPPKEPPFPASLFQRELDISDPYTFLFLKRGILQYVQVKPILAMATLLLKSLGKYNEGDLRAASGYLYVSIVYNVSICLALYCLAMFWLCVSDDLRPFRPMPKFLCVKGVLFFSFWQTIGISILVAGGVITKLGPYTDREHISLGLSDTLITFEMPLFAFAHMYAFSYHDYIDPYAAYVGRMPVWYAFRDAFGLKDVVEDTKRTLRGEGVDYREFEPSEGGIHQGLGRDRRIRAGLRYAEGGRKKYWLPRLAEEDHVDTGRVENAARRVVERVAGGRAGDTLRGAEEEDYAPLLEEEAANVVHYAPDLRARMDRGQIEPFISTRHQQDEDGDGFDLPFGELDDEDEQLFDMSRRYLFGDYNYPCIDVSSETAKLKMWDEEERILRDERGAYFARVRPHGKGGYGAVGSSYPVIAGGPDKEPRSGPDDWPEVPDERRRLVDFDDNRIQELDAGDVKLRWTKARTKPSRTSQPSSSSSSPRVRSPPMKQVPSTGSSASSAAGKSKRPSVDARSPPTPDSRRPVLPPDAVDLVVEDQQAAQEENTWERRKGEPAKRGLKKVYRRGYVVDDESHGEREVGEVEVEREREGDEGEIFKVADEDEDEVEEVVEREAEPIITSTAIEPPVHARLGVLPKEDNPWA